MKLYDSPSKLMTEESDEMSKLPPSQRKKMRQKQKKAEARAKKVILLVVCSHRCCSVGMFSLKILFDIPQEAEERNEEETTSSGMSKSGRRPNVRLVDLDPHGEKLMQVP